MSRNTIVVAECKNRGSFGISYYCWTLVDMFV